jgi:hypothetical protein
MESSELVEPRHHVRRGVKEDYVKEVRKYLFAGGYRHTTILALIGDAARGATDDPKEQAEEQR